MGSTSKELVQVSIKRPGNKLTAMLEKDHKICMPITEISKSSKGQGLSEKPGSKIKLTHAPITKKGLKHLAWRDACLALCRFPECVEDAVTAAKLMMLVLLCQLSHLLVGIAPMLPAISLGSAPSATLSVLGTLLCAIQGPEKWHGDDWMLLRPWVVCPQLSLCETKPSAALSDYIGGKFQTPAGKKKTFCYPYIDSTMVFAPGLPAVIEKALIACSPLSLPIVLGRRDAVKGRLILEWKTDGFASYDADRIEKLKVLGHDCYLEITLFLQWLCEKKKRVKHWKGDFDIFRPVTCRGSFTTPVSDEQTDLMCAALALFRQYLVYASEKNDWITREEAQEIMLYCWRLVLPESAPKAGDKQEESKTLNYAQPEIFYQFLTEWFLPTYCNQVLHAVKGDRETMGLIRSLDDIDFFITPRHSFLEAYAQWLQDHNSPTFDLSLTHADAAIQRTLFETGVPLKHESNNPSTWRYSFYGKKNGNVNCLALPIEQLPEAVQKVFGMLFGSHDTPAPGPSRYELNPDQRKGAEAL